MRTLLVVLTAGVLLANLVGADAESAAAPAAARAQTACAPPPTTAPPLPVTRQGFVPVAPLRLLDTRDGTGEPLGPVTAGCTAVVDLGRSPVPADASAVALTVTATEAAGPGYVTAYACGTARPYASNLNLRVGDPTPNLVVVPVAAATRAICLYTSETTHLVADLTGWFAPAGGAITPVTPTRLLDTRTALRPDAGVGPVAAGRVLTLPVGGIGVVPAAATAVVVNVTVDQPAAPGYVTAFPCGTPPPLASNVNHLAGQTRATQAMIGLGTDGGLCLYTYATAHLVVDLLAWVDTGRPGGPGVEQAPFRAALSPVAGQRLLDTRDGTGGPAVPLGAGEERPWDPWTSGSIAPGTVALVVNVTATEAAAGGYVRLAPCGSPQTTSSVNVVPGVDASNLAVVPLATDGRVCVFAYAGTHVVIDLVGTLALPTAISDLRTSPGLDQPVTTGLDGTLRCASSATTTVRVIPAPGVAATIDVHTPEGAVDPGPVPLYGVVMRTVAVTPDYVVVVRLVPRAGPPEERWLRCLPDDFPTFAVQTAGGAAAGWYLMDSGVFVTATPTTAPFAIIADEWGVPVWYRRLSVAAIDVHRQADGLLVWGEFSSPGFGTDPNLGYVVSRLDGTFVRRWKAVGVPTDYHDIVELPNGNRILIAYARRAGTVDLRSLGTDDQGNPLGATETVYDGVLQEVRPDGSAVWTWNTKDHVAPSEVTLPTRFAFVGNAVDLVHINAIDRLGNGDLLVSCRHLDAILRVSDPSQPGGGQIIQRIGGVGSDVTFPGQPIPPIARSHDVNLTDDGVLSVFDNRSPTPGRPLADPRGRAIRFHLDGAGAGATATQLAAVPLRAGSISFGLGSARWQPGGTVVVDWGGVAEPSWGEYDALARPLLEVNVYGGRLPYRVVKEPPSSFDRAELRATAGR